MRLLTIELEGESRPAICLDTGQVLDLRSAPDLVFEDEWRPRSLRGVLELSNGIERLKKIRDVAEENIEQLSSCILDDDKISLLPPVPDPWLILSVGMNYGQHLAEMDNTPRPKHPAAFIKTGSPVDFKISLASFFFFLEPLVPALTSGIKLLLGPNPFSSINNPFHQPF